MTSPDFSKYVDLTIYDLDPYSIYDEAVVYARTTLPEFAPRTGTLEDAIMQASAYNTALLASQINRLPDGIMEGVARLTGLIRNEATFATGTAEIEVFDNNGVTVAAGTVVQYEIVSDDIVQSYPFETTTDLVIPEGDTTGSVAIKALYAGQYPALLSGQSLSLVSPAPSVISVALDSALSIGTDPETDTQYFDRAVQHFASLSSVLTTKTQLANYIKSTYTNVPYFGVFDLTDSTSLAWSAADEAGYVTIVAGDINGDALNASTGAALLEDLQNKCVAGLSIGLESFDPVAITATCEIVLEAGYTSVEVKTAVDEYLTSKLSYTGYNFNGEIYINELISGVSNIAGVKYVFSLTTSSTDIDYSFSSSTQVISFANKNNVPDGDVTVTVV